MTKNYTSRKQYWSKCAPLTTRLTITQGAGCSIIPGPIPRHTKFKSQGKFQEHAFKQLLLMILMLVILWDLLPGRWKITASNQKSKRRNSFCVYSRNPSTRYNLDLMPQTAFAELLKLMRNFNSRILNVLFLVSVLRTNYTETQMVFSYLFFLKQSK